MRDRTLLAVLTAFTLTVCLLLVSTWGCVRLLSGVRAYVGGEGLYSKAQKNAVYYLELYELTRNEDWFSKFGQALRVPEGDRDARVELERANPNLDAVRRGFITGGNSPEDVDDLIFVFRRLRKTPYVTAAVDIWAQADAEIARLRALGDQIHGQEPAATMQASLAIEALNRRLTTLEDRFSGTLGAGARATSRELLAAIALLTVLLWGIGVLTFQRLLSAFTRERDNLRVTIDYAPFGIVLADAPAGRIRMANAQAWQVLGEPHPKACLEWSGFPVARALAGEIVRAENIEWIRPDGSRVWLRVSAAPVRRRGAIAGAVTAFQDISEERKVEDRILRQSQELARSNAELEQFAYITSHDLQEPLRNIANFSQLLAFSRVSNLDAAPMKPVDLNKVVEWARANLSEKIAETNAQVDVETLPTVRGDQVQLIQVFQNLIDNGIKYGGERKIVRISAVRDQGDWKITVRDNGLGIDPQYHQQIFGIFRRLHGRDVPGTGIGLALTRRVVERHGGRIWVDSGIGQGASFIFTLPDVAQPDAAVPQPGFTNSEAAP